MGTSSLTQVLVPDRGRQIRYVGRATGLGNHFGPHAETVEKNPMQVEAAAESGTVTDLRDGHICLAQPT